LISYFSDFRFVDPFRRYSRSKSKVVRNREKIWTVFRLSQILGGRPSKICTQVITPGSRHVVWIKVCDGIPISSELIDVYTLNFKPNFKFSRLTIFGETPVPVGVCASKASSISSACKNIRAQHPLWAEILYPKKCILVGPNSHVIPSR